MISQQKEKEVQRPEIINNDVLVSHIKDFIGWQKTQLDHLDKNFVEFRSALLSASSARYPTYMRNIALDFMNELFLILLIFGTTTVYQRFNGSGLKGIS